MVVGIGIDLCLISRIKLEANFIARILSKQELIEFATTQHQQNFLAKRWAAKEALSKASGHGITLGFRNITIAHENSGKPYFILNEAARNMLGNNISGNLRMHLSISDEGDYVTAIAIIENVDILNMPQLVDTKMESA